MQLFLIDLPKVVPFFIAIGALFGRAKMGAVAGLGVDLAFFLISAGLDWYNYGWPALFP